MGEETTPTWLQDALQFCYRHKLATFTHPERISNLYAYFLTVVRRKRLLLVLAQRQRTTPREDPGAALESGQHGNVVCGPEARSRPVDDLVRTAPCWLGRCARAWPPGA